ncbi:MAG TPA: DUF2062 domain-containing protein [Burkholderiales bacterium]|nr:DUF2062 domain-containing protein [Burkholderiales bacterium]
MRKFFRRYAPSDQTLRNHRTLRWLGPLLHRPWLWHMNRRTVAMGVGIGVFFGLLIPVFQIAGAALFAIMLRANLPVAAVSTLVSNPFTYAPIGVAAYKVGKAVLGERPNPQDEQMIERSASDATVTEVVEPGWWQRFAGIGKPVMVGLAIFAVVGGVSAYFLTSLAWRLGVVLRMRRRRRRSLRPPSRPSPP